MVRLVFRPYTQLRRSICTSESLRTSTRVSSGFILARHSSPSFGSQHVCSWYSPPAMGHASPEPAPRGDRPSARKKRAFTLIAPLGLVRPMTRTHVGLLGPCFKTGRVDHRPTRRRRAPLPQRRGATRAGTGMGPSQGQPGHRGVPVHGGTVPPTRAFDSPATGRGDLLRGKYARGSPRGGGRALRSPTPPPAGVPRTESPRSTFEVPPVFLSTVSRTLELSLQSSFQLSLTVLVRYRTRGDI